MVFSMATAFPTIQREISGNQINIFGCEQINNLYALKGNQPREESTKTPLTPQNDPQVHATSHVQTVEENSKFLTPKGIVQARVAKWLLHMLCYFSVVDLKAMIETNAIWDNLVTESDLKLMELLYGTDIATMKGKNTRQCPHQLVRNVVSSPHIFCDAQCNVCLYIDIISVNGMPFLTTLSKNIKYHTAIWVADCNPTTIEPLVESVLNLYQQASFQVSNICNDHEFKLVLSILLDDGWLFITNLANAQEHVPEAQQNNHILKEHIHATYHGIPYTQLPHTVLCYMVMETMAKLNCFPAKGGFLNYFSPREISHHDMSSLTTRSTVPCLFLVSFLHMMNQPLPISFMHVHWTVVSYVPYKNKQGGYECYHISTHQVIT